MAGLACKEGLDGHSRIEETIPALGSDLECVCRLVPDSLSWNRSNRARLAGLLSPSRLEPDACAPAARLRIALGGDARLRRSAPHRVLVAKPAGLGRRKYLRPAHDALRPRLETLPGRSAANHRS